MSDDRSGGDDLPPWFDAGPLDGGESIDLLADALADRRARHVVSALESRSENTVELGDLVDSVVEREARAEQPDEKPDRSGPADRENHRQRVAIALHHRSLPKLDDAAVLDYDPRTNTVRFWGDGRISAYLEFFDREANV
ncbi:DUF7344 domain-containing protein [Halorussus ruber]|uniref:DUF7344 domain-containing protein n=1 Tax=Halorussus ruber TaxID=1126238 RepID=UPI0010931502|nr:hypothetical protein [Halorussus ruber]